MVIFIEWLYELAYFKWPVIFINFSWRLITNGLWLSSNLVVYLYTHRGWWHPDNIFLLCVLSWPYVWPIIFCTVGPYPWITIQLVLINHKINKLTWTDDKNLAIELSLLTSAFQIYFCLEIKLIWCAKQARSCAELNFYIVYTFAYVKYLCNWYIQ